MPWFGAIRCVSRAPCVPVAVAGRDDVLARGTGGYGSRHTCAGAQDLLNILFGLHPDIVLLFTCRWNYRTDHCMYGNNCADAPAEQHGIGLMHASRSSFHDEQHPLFPAVYRAFLHYDMRQSFRRGLYEPLADHLRSYHDPTACRAMAPAVLKMLRTVAELEDRAAGAAAQPLA